MNCSNKLCQGWCDPWENRSGEYHGGCSGQGNGHFREGNVSVGRWGKVFWRTVMVNGKALGPQT